MRGSIDSRRDSLCCSRVVRWAPSVCVWGGMGEQRRDPWQAFLRSLTPTAPWPQAELSLPRSSRPCLLSICTHDPPSSSSMAFQSFCSSLIFF